MFSEIRSGISQSLARKLSDSLLHHNASRISPWVWVKLFKCFGKLYLWHPKKGNIEKMSSQHERIRVFLDLRQNFLQFPRYYYLLIHAMGFTSTEVLFRIPNSIAKRQMWKSCYYKHCWTMTSFLVGPRNISSEIPTSLALKWLSFSVWSLRTSELPRASCPEFKTSGAHFKHFEVLLYFP